MSDLRAAAQQALEAWEHINKYGFVLADYEGPMEQAINALKAALAQQEEGRMEFNVKETVCAKCGSTNGAHSHDCPAAKAALKERNT